MEKSLGKRIAEYRREKGLKQEELADALGISAQAVSKWENDVSCPDILLLVDLAEQLGVTVDELLRGKKRDTTVEYFPEAERKAPESLILSIRINSKEGDVVKINLPLPLIKILLNSGASVSMLGGNKAEALNGINWEQVMTLIDNGVLGKIVEIKSADGDTVEVMVE